MRLICVWELWDWGIRRRIQFTDTDLDSLISFKNKDSLFLFFVLMFDWEIWRQTLNHLDGILWIMLTVFPGEHARAHTVDGPTPQANPSENRELPRGAVLGPGKGGGGSWPSDIVAVGWPVVGRDQSLFTHILAAFQECVFSDPAHCKTSSGTVGDFIVCIHGRSFKTFYRTLSSLKNFRFFPRYPLRGLDHYVGGWLEWVSTSTYFLPSRQDFAILFLFQYGYRI